MCKSREIHQREKNRQNHLMEGRAYVQVGAAPPVSKWQEAKTLRFCS